ncbi:STAS domain-containing protein [Saccharothrix isguenensis]
MWVLRPSPEQAEHVCGHLSRWLRRVRAAGVGKVVIDLSRVRRLDFTGFGVFLASVRDVTGLPAAIIGARGHLTETLRRLDLLAGAEVVPAGQVQRAVAVATPVRREPGAGPRLTRPLARAA